MKPDQQRPSLKKTIKQSFCIVCNNWAWLVAAMFLRSFVPVMFFSITLLLALPLKLGGVIVSCLIAMAMAIYLDFGLLRLMLSLARGNKGSCREIFSIPSLDVCKYAVVTLVLFAGLCLGLIILLLPGILFFSCFCFSRLLVIDHREGIFGSFSRSLQMTSGSVRTIAIIMAVALMVEFLLQLMHFPISLEYFFIIAICSLYVRTAADSPMDCPESPRPLNVAAAVLLMPFSGTLIAILSLIVFRSCFESRFISSLAMLPTLQVNDRVLIEKSSNFGLSKLQRGDIVVFYPPPSEMPDRKDLSPKPSYVLGRLTGLAFLPYEPAFVKRIIGLPGETIRIERGVGTFINGQLLAEPYIQEAANYDLRVLGDIGMSGRVAYEGRPQISAEQAVQQIVVPPNHLFLLGDNRINSQDSHVWGFLDQRRVIGRAWLKFYPKILFFSTSDHLKKH